MGDSKFYGSVTVGERGQVVIPADARSELSIQPGDKLLVMRAPHNQALLMCKFEDLQSFLGDFVEAINKFGESMKEAGK